MLIGLKYFVNSKVLFFTFKTCALFNYFFYILDVLHNSFLYIVKKTIFKIFENKSYIFKNIILKLIQVVLNAFKQFMKYLNT